MTLHSIRPTEITPAGYYGPYRTIDILVPGVQDTVYLAERADTGARVALRVFAEDAARDEDLLRALRDHAGRVTTLSARCPAIATVYECGVTPDALYLALEHPDGVTLAETLRRDGPFRPERAVRVAIGITEPLEVAHMLGVVHGCLSPQNVVLVGEDEGVKLTHFGIDWVRTTRWLSRRGARAVGAATTPYQAPEQSLTGEATHQSDVFAVAALLYEMLTGRPPGTQPAMRRRGGTLPVRKLRPEVSRTLEKIVMRALSPTPARRYRDMTDLFNDLWSEISPFSGTMQQRDTGPRERARGRKLVVLASGAIVAGVVVVALGAAVMLGAPWLGEREPDTFVRQPARIPAEDASPAPSVAQTPADSTPPAPEAPSVPETPPVVNAPVTPAPAPPAVVTRPPTPPVPPAAAARDVARSSPPTPRVMAPRPAPESASRPAPVEAPRSTAAARTVTQPTIPPQEPSRREASDDGGAIIDWLLKEGSSRR